MSDLPRTDLSRTLATASVADRDAKIEQLLLVGLDHYFAAQYNQAINVWTRALFLDRSHARARAYIERARSALAERQRASEELLQTGVAAFHRGDRDEARRLLSAAIDGDAPSDEALAVLGRLNRLENVVPGPLARATRGGAAARAPADTRAAGSRTAAILVLLLIVAAGVVGVVSWERVGWPSDPARRDAPGAAAVTVAPREVLLPTPSRGETALARGRALAANGRLHDALSLLETIRPTDAEKPEGDRLRADIQRQLLGIAAAISAPPPAGELAGGRVR